MKFMKDMKTSADLAAAFGGSAVWGRRAPAQTTTHIRTLM
jgi:hypothetical protein